MRHLFIFATLVIVLGLCGVAHADDSADGAVRVIQFDAAPTQGVEPHHSIYISGSAAKLLGENMEKIDLKSANMICRMENGEHHCAIVFKAQSSAAGQK